MSKIINILFILICGLIIFYIFYNVYMIENYSPDSNSTTPECIKIFNSMGKTSLEIDKDSQIVPVVNQIDNKTINLYQQEYEKAIEFYGKEYNIALNKALDIYEKDLGLLMSFEKSYQILHYNQSEKYGEYNRKKNSLFTEALKPIEQSQDDANKVYEKSHNDIQRAYINKKEEIIKQQEQKFNIEITQLKNELQNEKDKVMQIYVQKISVIEQANNIEIQNIKQIYQSAENQALQTYNYLIDPILEKYKIHKIERTPPQKTQDTILRIKKINFMVNYLQYQGIIFKNLCRIL